MNTVGHIIATLCASGLLSLSALALVVSGSSLEDADLVLVVSYPWGSQASRIIQKSGLKETYPVRAPLGSMTVVSGPNDITNLKKNGAWLLLDGKKVATLCSPQV
ncbi:hypothetical protein [Pelagimonas varians]|uniref:Uncharacterized protein n=1 Tax=Pelagimonas varians TaxID=696760 RepID=A0A238K3Z2_9RHOB|nr:hypothetical protein [Pelagimonas varians]PYG30442.1 hypothetical protein C8N36_106150 [Pelagimonas varians]SMX37609.1 hypothetical protein PEV8663_01140 [Pelagimonas varians]